MKTPELTERQAFMILNDLPNIGPITLNRLLAEFDGDPAAILRADRRRLETVRGVGPETSAAVAGWTAHFDLVREEEVKRRVAKKRKEGRPTAASKDAAAVEDKAQEAIDLVLETVEALLSERGEDERVWGSMVKQAIKRRKPNFNESYYGFRAFSDLLDEAAKRGVVELERDEKSGGYVIRIARKT